MAGPKSDSKADLSRDRAQQGTTRANPMRWLERKNWERRWGIVWAVIAATATALDLSLVQGLERQIQTVFFQVRGAVTAPEQVVILTIDNTSLAQGEFFRADPQRYAELAPLQAWPWQRTAYAIAIERLMEAGAQAIGIDVIFSTPSSYGEADDQRLTQALQQYGDRVVLAARYDQLETPQGSITQLVTPLSRFCLRPDCSGFINFLIEPDGRIHQLGEPFLSQLLANSPPLQAEVLEKRPSFAQATLQAAQIPDSSGQGNTIFFYGPAQTFAQIPFWYVLDSSNWRTTLQSGAYFKDKIVLIGATASSLQDFHPTPFSNWRYSQPMSGVEIHANAVATLLQRRTMREAIPKAAWRGLFVLVGVAGISYYFSRPPSPLRQFVRALGVIMLWTSISYGLFHIRLIVPTAVPAAAILFGGFSQLVTGTLKDQMRKRRLRDTLKQHVTSPIVQEIISQDDDLQDLLRERELALAGKILGGRYQISRVLGAGGFSETYVAEDLQRPGHPLCVVKQLRVPSHHPNTLKLAQRLFITEAETLEKLGRHAQIPQLLAYFEENHEFYLVQELVEGHSLSRELLPDRSLPETKVATLLSELLEVLAYVHQQEVVHRDLKPSNIMRRHADGKLVLIDFGIAKKITNQLAVSEEQTKFTIPVGTPGYMPGEQLAGRPRFNSDLFALGMIGIEALTGITPRTLESDPRNGAVLWTDRVNGVNPNLQIILNKMVHPDPRQRYQSVQEVRSDLMLFCENLIESKLPTVDSDCTQSDVIKVNNSDVPFDDEITNDTTAFWRSNDQSSQTEDQ